MKHVNFQLKTKNFASFLKKLNFLIIYFLSLFQMNLLYAQGCGCFGIPQEGSTPENKILSAGCDKICRIIAFDGNGCNIDREMVVSHQIGRYTLVSLTLQFVNSNFDIITITPNLTVTNNSISTTYDPGTIPFYLPSDNSYTFYTISYCFNSIRGNLSHPNYDVYSYIGLHGPCGNEPDFDFDIFNGSEIIGLPVTGNASELFNDPLIGPYINKGAMYVVDQVTLDESNIAWGNYIFTFAPGAKLILKNATINYFEGTLFRGCDEMYKGIQIEGGATADFKVSQVRDAEIGILLKPNSNVTSNGNIITQCAIGIKSDHANFYSEDNTFNTSSRLPWLPTFSGQIEVPLQNKMNTGLLTINNNMLIDFNSHYNNIWNGLVSNASTNIVIESDFNDIITQNNDFDNFGNAMLLKDSYGSNLSVIGDNDINDCTTGVRILGAKTEISSNSIFDVDYGIIAKNSSAPLTCEGNEIKSRIYGIQLNSCTGSQKKLEYNEITNVGTQGSIDDGCIYINNPQSITKANLNTMYIKGGIFGYRGTPGYPSIIQKNTALFENSTRSFGFGFHIDGNRSYLSCNTSAAPASSDKEIYGYHQNMANANFNCNLTTGNLRRGFSILESNPASYFAGNEVGGNLGLLVEEGSMLSLSSNLVNNGNCWTGSSVKDALNKNLSAPLVSMSRFTVNQQQSSCYLPDWEANATWFVNLTNQNTTYSCGNLCPNGGAGSGFGPSPCDYAEELIPLINNSIEYANFPNERRWTDHFQVYKLLIESDCNSLSQTMQYFVDQNSDSEIGNLVQVDLSLKNLALDSDGPLSSALDSLNSIQDTLINQLNSFSGESWFKWDTSIVTNILNDFSVNHETLDSILNEYISSINTELGNLLDFNSNTSTNTDLGGRLKYCNDLLIKSMQCDSFSLDSTQEQEIIELAYLCPSEGSFATLKARSLLHILGYHDVFDDSPCYDTSSQQLKVLPIKYDQLIVSPVPAKDHVWAHTQNYSTIVKISVMDYLGRIILKTEDVNSSEIDMDLSLINSGYYLVEVMTLDGSMLRTKILISK